MRQRVRIDREFRRQFCHHCYAFLVPGRNMRVRVHRGNVVVTCQLLQQEDEIPCGETSCRNRPDTSMQDLKPTVWIGKQGCTGTMIDEIVSQLKKRKLIKVKWLQNTDVDPEAVAAGQRQDSWRCGEGQ